MRKIILILLGAILLSACDNCKLTDLEKLELSSWKDTLETNPEDFSIYSIIDFVNAVTCKDSKNFVQVEDRIAVFDMDGTIACERPLSMEMLCAYYLAYKSLPNCETAINDSTKKHIEKSIYDMQFDSEKFVEISAFLSDTIRNKCIPVDTSQRTSRLLSKQFYKPMLELIQYLKRKEFDVYIVSGSEQQFIWGVVQNVKELDFDRQHIIGSLTNYESIVYTREGGTKFYLDSTILLSNSSKGKSTNIYNRINKTPIFAFGNTVNDFDMFAFTSSNKHHRTMCVLLNHDSDTFEAEYNPFDTCKHVSKNWNNTYYNDSTWNTGIFENIMLLNQWNKMDMSKVFKQDSIFID
ncbi:MAG: haloacid dehalogenase-like hydrolase [Bacteroidales bacterium]|nr:haloacid dehalogenase-like hydrolase [Bacteroidales bacterium]